MREFQDHELAAYTRSHFYEKSPYRTREGGSAIDGFTFYMLMRYRTGVRFEKIELVFDYLKDIIFYYTIFLGGCQIFITNVTRSKGLHKKKHTFKN